MRSRSSSDGRSACCLHQAASRASPKQSPVVVHRLGDAVGVEQEQIAAAERQRHFLEQPVEPLARRRSAGRAPGRPAPASAAARDGAYGPGHVDQRAMAGARVGQRPRAEIDDGVGHRDEAPAVEMPRDDAVGVDQQLARRRVQLAERQHQPLELRHVERRRRSLAGDVGDQHAERDDRRSAGKS